MDIEIAICANPPVRQNDAVTQNRVDLQHQVCENTERNSEMIRAREDVRDSAFSKRYDSSIAS